MTPLPWMKFSRFGICSRSDGTLGLSRRRCTLSKTILITRLVWPPGELSWHAADADCEAAPSKSRPSANEIGAHNVVLNLFMVFSRRRRVKIRNEQPTRRDYVVGCCGGLTPR